jgi:uncharacterized lipoprotein YddW (UPF0748 family)
MIAAVPGGGQVRFIQLVVHRLGSLVIGLALAAGAAAQPPAPEPAELRGAWVDRSSLVSREEIRATLTAMAGAGFNVAFVNAWSRGYPLWKSEVFAEATGVAGDPGLGGRDVLREAIEEAERAGIAVMPWVEYGFAGGYSGYHPGPGGRGPIFERHPDWLARTRSGATEFTAPNGFFSYMVQARPDVQEFLLSLMAELARGYRSAGIQFDRARYPQLDCGYDPYTLDLYRREHAGLEPPKEPADPGWVRWRADRVNAFVAALHRRLREADPRGMVSSAPITYPYGYDNFAQDYPAWLREGSLDFVVPQIYRRDAASYAAALDEQIAAVGGDPSRMVAGLDVTNSSTAALVGMIELTRRRGLRGVVVWYYRSLVQAGALPVLKAGVFARPAPLPRWERPSARQG